MIVTILTGFVVILSSNFADPAKVYDFDGYCYKDMRKFKISENLFFDLRAEIVILISRIIERPILFDKIIISHYFSAR